MDGHDTAPCSPNRSVLLERCVDVKVSRKPSPDKAWTPEQYFRPSRTIDHRRPCVTPFGTCFRGGLRQTSAGRLCDNRRDRDAWKHISTITTR